MYKGEKLKMRNLIKVKLVGLLLGTMLAMVSDTRPPIPEIQPTRLVAPVRGSLDRIFRGR